MQIKAKTVPITTCWRGMCKAKKARIPEAKVKITTAIHKGLHQIGFDILRRYSVTESFGSQPRMRSSKYFFGFIILHPEPTYGILYGPAWLGESLWRLLFLSSFFGYVEQILSGLLEEVLVGFFFGVIVPVPHFDSVACGVGDNSFPFKDWMITNE